jgi:aminodeoxyfutalosine deaminase
LSEREAILFWASHQFFGDAVASLKNFGEAQDKICRVQPINGIPNMFSSVGIKTLVGSHTLFMRKITADYVFPVSSEPIRNGVVVLDDAGKILSITTRDQYSTPDLEVYSGTLTPGLVNTHCHLELSHMKGKVDTGTGLIPFITGVVTQRNADAAVIAAAIEQAEQAMLDGGIVAVGDISNAPDTFIVKSKHRLHYHTFVELFDFLQDNGAEKAMQDWTAVLEQIKQTAQHRATLVPHAPYSVSPTLFQRIRDFNPSQGATVSIHNQETPPENELFLHKTGDFLRFYGGFGISLDGFSATGQTAIHYALAHLNPNNRTLFVHNTLTTPDDIAAAQAWSPHVFWATCPNANLYIENRLPNYRYFIDAGARMTIGTDSLTSNWQLSVLEEMKTIARYQSYVPFATLLRWATLNGAEALGFDDTLGSLEVGKTPGLVLWDGLANGEHLSTDTSVRRLV